MDQTEVVWLNKPQPQLHPVSWSPPPPAANPKVTGLPLVVASKLVSSLPPVQAVLWRNAGLDILRDLPALTHIEPRYDPTVIRTTAERALRSEQHDVSVETANLLTEDWSKKRLSAPVYHSILDYHEAYLSGRLTPSAVVAALLPLIRRDLKDQAGHWKAFLESRVDLITAAAEASTARYQQGKPLSPMDGVPVAVKDEHEITGYRKFYGTKIDFKHNDEGTSWCVQRWLDAGTILLGRTNMHELGMDITSNNPNWSTPVNPHNERYYTGGSSGGSAYAVAAGLSPVCIGGDGGGSIRVPSSYCGLYGLKPSHGRVSVRPSSNYSKTTTVAGPIAASVLDLEIAWRVLAQPDVGDTASAQFPLPRAVLPEESPRAGKIPLGIYKPWFDAADDVVKTLCRKAIAHLTSTGGYEVVDIEIPLISEGQLAHSMTILNEVVSVVPSSKMHMLTPANQILLHVGSQTSAAYLVQAQKVRNILMQHMAALYEAHPGLIVVTPTTPEAGWHFQPGDLTYGVTDVNLQLRNMKYVWLANFTGCPAISCPVGYADPAVEAGKEGKIPVGLMGMAEWSGEEPLIRFGYDLEKYVNGVYVEGRRRPKNFVDVLGLAAGV